jgi:hypothetical protein
MCFHDSLGDRQAKPNAFGFVPNNGLQILSSVSLVIHSSRIAFADLQPVLGVVAFDPEHPAIWHGVNSIKMMLAGLVSITRLRR